ncbi:MAG: DUF1804 family protein [Bacteroidia bacterium]|nr:DUF1804 family protein [Bacteroidia bacterium]
MANVKRNAKLLAMEYYMNSDLSNGQIAKLLAISERTVDKWAKQDKWAEIKKARVVSATNIEKLAYEVSNKFMQGLAKKEEVLVGDIDAIAKMSAALEKISGKTNLSNRIAILTDFVQWVQIQHPNHAEDTAQLAQEYIKQKA